ncbi:MAG: hypothetical protein HS132_09595 [Planctomycetia bacterium]|nr:hypothetical protein [Planctomycetia bacterium]
MKQSILTTKERGLTMPKQMVLEFPVEFPGKSVQDKEALRKAKESMILELL